MRDNKNNYGIKAIAGKYLLANRLQLFGETEDRKKILYSLWNLIDYRLDREDIALAIWEVSHEIYKNEFEEQLRFFEYKLGLKEIAEDICDVYEAGYRVTPANMLNMITIY